MKIVSLYFLVGFVLGTIYEILKFIVHIFKHHISIQIITDFLFTIIFGASVIILNHCFFLGEFRLHLLIFCFLGFYIERKTVGKIFAKLFLLLYNKVSKVLNKFKSTPFGKIISK